MEAMLAAAGWAENYARQSGSGDSLLSIAIVLVNVSFFATAALVWWSFHRRGRYKITLRALLWFPVYLSLPMLFLSGSWPLIAF